MTCELREKELAEEPEKELLQTQEANEAAAERAAHCFLYVLGANRSTNLAVPQNSSRPNSTLATSDVSRRKWLIPGAEYSIFTGQPLDTQDSKADGQLEGTRVPG
ncbi:M-phase phosphoprotein 9 [Camelus dromedarius]|nr:M-phase phosphoprotein 9 [Camelus dromedarius]